MNPEELDLGPHWERVDEDTANDRIREQLADLPNDKMRTGLENVNEHMKEHDIHPAVRLHYISTVAELGRVQRGENRSGEPLHGEKGKTDRAEEGAKEDAEEIEPQETYAR